MISRTFFTGLGLLALAACSTDGQIDETGGIQITRSACPAVAVPVATGDVTLFDPPASRDARAIDVVANVTNVRSTCQETADQLVVTATFDVFARRRDAGAARDIVLPYFATVMQGGSQVVSKRLQGVRLSFAAGQTRASTRGQTTAQVSRAATALPAEVRERLTRRRKPGDPDAAIDPMSDPAVRGAVQRATFELLVGFQLTPEQLAYNATR